MELIFRFLQLASWCCTCFTFGRAAERMKTFPDPDPEKLSNWNGPCAIMCAANCFSLGWIPIWLQRTEIRNRFGIEGNGCTDCLVSGPLSFSCFPLRWPCSHILTLLLDCVLLFLLRRVADERRVEEAGREPVQRPQQRLPGGPCHDICTTSPAGSLSDMRQYTTRGWSEYTVK